VKAAADPRMTLDAFRSQYSRVRLARKTANALAFILVHGWTWHKACSVAGVYPSTVARALRRHPPQAR
jgi:hypothetical protein